MADTFAIVASEGEGDNSYTGDILRRAYIYQTDNNALSYTSGQILFDTHQVTNTPETYTDKKQSFLFLPCVMEVNATGYSFSATSGVGVAENAFAASLKNGYHQLIHQISVKLDGTTIVNKSAFNNLKANFELLTESSYNDLMRSADLMGFYPDSAESQAYSPNAGVCNNIIVDAAFNTSDGFKFANKGRQHRMKISSVNTADAQLAALFANMGTGAFDISYMGYVKTNTASTIGYVMTAIIPLRVIHSFREVPLMRSTRWSIQIDTPMPCSSTVSYAIGGTVSGVSTTTQNGATFPCMLSPLKTNAGEGGLRVTSTAAAGSITVSLSIGRSASGLTEHPIKSCRLYLSQVTLSPQAENVYLSKPIKTFIYKDHFTPSAMYNIARNSPFDQTLHTDMSNVRGILICPFVSASANGATGVVETMSPLSSAPGTSAPYGSLLTNLNVWIRGVPLFMQNLNYRFENFQDFLQHNNVFGGSSVGQSTGLLSYRDFSTAYGFTYVDLSRVDKSMDSMDKSVRVAFTNSSPFMCDYQLIIIRDCVATVNVEFGVLANLVK